MALVSQCCGLAGVGDVMVSVAEATGSQEFLDSARTVASVILARSGGEPARPTFPGNSLTHPSSGWATGSAGVLAFLRRLRDGGGPRLGRLD
jgi:hypothetical protein